MHPHHRAFILHCARQSYDTEPQCIDYVKLNWKIIPMALDGATQPRDVVFLDFRPVFVGLLQKEGE